MRTKIAALALSAMSLAGVGAGALAPGASASIDPKTGTSNGPDFIHYAVTGGYTTYAECAKYDHGLRSDVAHRGRVWYSNSKGCIRLHTGKYSYGWTVYETFDGKPLKAGNGDPRWHNVLPAFIR